MSDKSDNAYNEIVLGIDGSDHAMAAVKLLASLPIPQDCKISIISVILPRNTQYATTLDQMLDQVSETLKHKDREVETHLLTGNPAEQIINFAKNKKPKMIILGAKGLRGTFRIFLGGVAQQVVEFAPCPVLIVRADHTEIKNVLLTTDGSEHSLYAIEHLSECPLPKEAKITVLHVLPPVMTMEMLIRSWPYGIDALPPILSSEMDQNLEERASQEEKEGEALLEQTVKDLSYLDQSMEKVLLRGDAATEILNFSEEQNIDLIIAGSRGLNQFRSWLLGSVSNKLTHYANSSVLIVKKP